MHFEDFEEEKRLEYIIGKDCIYEDYLGERRLGKIVAYEEIQLNESDFICLVYVQDVLDNSYNDKQDYVGTSLIRYADIRQSTELELLD